MSFSTLCLTSSCALFLCFPASGCPRRMGFKARLSAGGWSCCLAVEERKEWSWVAGVGWALGQARSFPALDLSCFSF